MTDVTGRAGGRESASNGHSNNTSSLGPTLRLALEQYYKHLLIQLWGLLYWLISIIPTFSNEKAEAQEDFIICPSLTAAVAGAMMRSWQLSQEPALYTFPTSHFRATPGGLSKEQKHPTQPICINQNCTGTASLNTHNCLSFEAMGEKSKDSRLSCRNTCLRLAGPAADIPVPLCPAFLGPPEEGATAPPPAVLPPALPSIVPPGQLAAKRTTTQAGQRLSLLGELETSAVRDRGSPFYLALGASGVMEAWVYQKPPTVEEVDQRIQSTHGERGAEDTTQVCGLKCAQSQMNPRLFSYKRQ